MKARTLVSVPQDADVHTGSAALDPDLICEEIGRFFDEMRDSIAKNKTALSQQVDGQVFGGKYADDQGEGSPRTDLASKGEIRVDKPLSSSFLLVLKHPAAFTALLDTLVRWFRVYATVRNPLSVLSSWETVPFPVRDGHLPAAEQNDRDLAAELKRIDDRLDRQLHLLGWFFGKYALLPRDRVIPYESIIESRGRALSAITSRASALDEPLQSRNSSTLYDRDAMLRIGERLMETDGPYWDYYTRESVTELLES
jgi:hypothetical protein